MDPWVVGVFDTVLLANLSNFWRDEGIPGTGHAREQVVLHLKVKSTREAS